MLSFTQEFFKLREQNEFTSNKGKSIYFFLANFGC